jgi:hypothetical protein
MTDAITALGGNPHIQAAGVGAGGGAALGALATLLQKNPSVKKALRNALLGAGTGGALGAGYSALKSKQEESPAAELVETEPKKQLNPLIAAALGAIPGVGNVAAAAHGANFGVGQAAASGLASFGAAFPMQHMLLHAKSPRLQALAGPLSLLAAAGGAAGAAAGGNALREHQTKKETPATA